MKRKNHVSLWDVLNILNDNYPETISLSGLLELLHRNTSGYGKYIIENMIKRNLTFLRNEGVVEKVPASGNREFSTDNYKLTDKGKEAILFYEVMES